MGRGDVRTKKGKIKARSHGNTRPAGAPAVKIPVKTAAKAAPKAAKAAAKE